MILTKFRLDEFDREVEPYRGGSLKSLAWISFDVSQIKIPQAKPCSLKEGLAIVLRELTE